jgi:mutator protein MutT
MTPFDVAIGVVLSEGRIAICQRKQDTHLGGYWEFPGGKFEPGETPAQCLRREVQEELGVTVDPVRPFAPIEFAYPDRAIRLHPFLCRILADHPAPHASADLRWVRPAELLDYPFPPANARLIEQLLQMLAG